MEALISTSEVARREGVSTRTVQRWIKDPEVRLIVARKHDREFRLRYSDVLDYLRRKGALKS